MTCSSPQSRHAPAVSIVVPVFNGERHLRRLVSSLQAQTFHNFEVIAVDDRSTDSSRSILIQYAASDERLRVLQTPYNLGTAPRVINFALPEVRGQHFAYSSQDDFFSPDWLDSMIKRSEETNAGAIVPDMVYFSGSGSDHTLSGLDGNREVVLSNREAVEASLSWRIPGCALWSTKNVRRVGWADTTFDGDELSVRKLFHASGTIAFSKGTYYYNQANTQAITKVVHPRQLQSITTALDLRDFLHEHEYRAPLYQ